MIQNTLLATKTVSALQEKKLQEAGFAVVSYDAIHIEFLDFEMPDTIENVIFTSQNAVKSFLTKTSFQDIHVINCFCVGEKTKAFLEENGQKVLKMTNYASELADFIVKKHKKETFYFFCGNIRSDVLPSELKKAKIPLFEVKTYKTTLNVTRFDQKWNAILFFSPSGVRSFTSENDIGDSLCVCIGNTTASEAKKFTNNVIVSETTTIESVIETIIKNN